MAFRFGTLCGGTKDGIGTGSGSFRFGTVLRSLIGGLAYSGTGIGEVAPPGKEGG